jgi:hypothetical protein
MRQAGITKRMLLAPLAAGIDDGGDFPPDPPLGQRSVPWYERAMSPTTQLSEQTALELTNRMCRLGARLPVKARELIISQREPALVLILPGDGIRVVNSLLRDFEKAGVSAVQRARLRPILKAWAEKYEKRAIKTIKNIVRINSYGVTWEREK